MVMTRKKLNRTVLKLSVGALAFASFGAAVAAPIMFVPKAKIFPVTHVSYAPLAAGPALQLAKSGPGMSEDCVRVTQITGPDGKNYPTRGIVCSGVAD